jgi:hypothetical protein
MSSSDSSSEYIRRKRHKDKKDRRDNRKHSKGKKDHKEKRRRDYSSSSSSASKSSGRRKRSSDRNKKYKDEIEELKDKEIEKQKKMENKKKSEIEINQRKTKEEKKEVKEVLTEAEKLHYNGHVPFVNDMAPFNQVGITGADQALIERLKVEGFQGVGGGKGGSLPLHAKQELLNKGEENVVATKKTVNRRSIKRAAKPT